MLRILIVDDHDLVRRSIRSMLSTRSDWAVCGEARDGIEAIEQAMSLHPDVILMDVSMPRMDGIAATKAIQRELPESNVIIVSQNDAALMSMRAAEVNARGYVEKRNIARDLVGAIEQAAPGSNKTDGSATIHENMQSTGLEPTADADVDLSEHGLAQQAKNHLAAIVDSSDDAIISKNLNGIITSWNKSAERIFGYQSEEAIGQHITLIIPEDRREEEVGILKRLRRGERIDHIETIRRRKDGSLLDLSITISPVKDGSGRIVGASKVARDITQSKRIERALKESEERLRTLSDNLELEVRLHTRELEQRNSEILQQSDQLRELSNRLLKTQEDERRHIARELHDSAGQIVAALGMNLAGIDRYAKDNPELRKVVDDTRQLVQQLSKEIRTTSYLLHPPLLDESGLPEAIRWYLQGLRERSGLEVELHIPEDFDRLPADLELAAFRIVQESLTNIHRHSGSKTAIVRLSRANDHVSLEIEDHGKGISPEKLTAIRAQRTGVGMTGMRERVRHLKGEMNIHSNGTGATVAVILPIPQVPTAPA